MTLQDRPAVRSAAEAFAAAMAKVPVKYRSPQVGLRVAEAEARWSAGLDPRIARLAIAFAPIYREPKTGRLYPDLRRRLVAAVSDALLRACAEFLARSGAWSPPTHRALGRRVFVEAVERVDRRIDQIARSFDFLLAITPINAEAARQEFRSRRFAAAPRLLYRPLTVEVDVEKRRLFSIPFGNLEDPLLHDLYRQKQQEGSTCSSRWLRRGRQCNSAKPRACSTARSSLRCWRRRSGSWPLPAGVRRPATPSAATTCAAKRTA